MDATMLFHLPPHRVHYDYSHRNLYQPVMPSQPSYVRSSASRPLHPFPSHHLPYPHSLAACSPSSSSGSNPGDRSPAERPLEYGAEADYDSAQYGSGNVYPGDYFEPHSTSWSVPAKPTHLSEMYSSSFDFPPPMAATGNSALPSQYVKAEEGNREECVLESYYSGFGPEPSLASYSTLPGPPPSISLGFGPQVQPAAHPEDPAYMLTLQEMQYPLTSDHIPRYVHPAQVSPNISPAVAFAQLQDTAEGCDPRFTISPQMARATTPFTEPDSSGSLSGSPPLALAPEKQIGQKRTRRESYSSTSSSEYRGDSGESERPDEDEDGDGEMDDDDDEYVQRASSRPRTRRRAASSVSDAPSTASYGQTSSRRLAPPVPIPNLTKKSRGRRVPTGPVIVSRDGVPKNTRTYACDVAGCGKCFARGEHLKRHVRSIHTNEKPHKCPAPGCGRDFSRHDNLGQHMRVHKNFSAPKSGRRA